MLGALFIAELMDAQIDRWMHAATLPTLLALGLGKLSSVLAAEGQGAPSDLPWATAYLGDGPWEQPRRLLPSHPAQVYEAGITVIVLVAMALVLGGQFRDDVMDRHSSSPPRRGRWAGAWLRNDVARCCSRGTDPAEQLILAVLAVSCVAIVLRLRTREPAGANGAVRGS